MRVILACLAVVVVIGALAIAPDPRTVVVNVQPDPRTGFVNVQPLLIAQINGWERRAVAETDRSLNSVELIDDLGIVAHIRGYYRTVISKPVDRLYYQMIVVHDQEGDTYTSTCFVLRLEMVDGRRGCF